MPVPQTSDDRSRRALLLLFLLAREAGLPLDEVDGPDARELVAAALPHGEHRKTTVLHAPRPWMCSRRRAS